MKEVKLTTPIKKDELLKLEVGDKVAIWGEIFTARDKAHQKALKHIREGEELPVSFDGAVVYHCGPLLTNDWRVIAAGPTTSARMNEPTAKLLDMVDCMAVVGKGGMNKEVLKAMKGKGIYLAVTGGTGALTAQSIKKVKDCHWDDLGMAEAIWVFEVENFQCIVGMDAHGTSIYD
ncbi:MAG: FumA C-terminus/TtdB family hydratase beta subunit [Archaeoglobaceae archaeon]